MKKYSYKSVILITLLLFALPVNVLADEKDDGHPLEVEVNGFHVTLENQNGWTKGENIIVVTIADDMGSPVKNAEVEILVTQKTDGHVESEPESHDEYPEEDAHKMSMEEPSPEATGTTLHEESSAPIPMLEADEHGRYRIETYLESTGKHDVHVVFLVNNELLQADFVVEIPGTSSKMIVLWSFVLVNVAVVISAGIMKKQSLMVKSGQ